LPRRNFYYSYPVPGDGSDAAYNAAGIVLDNDFVRRSDGKVRDLSPSGYAGTVTGVIVPGKEGEGANVPAATAVINHGIVSQLNNATTFSLEEIIENPPGAFALSILGTRALTGTNYVEMDTTAAAKINFSVANGLASSATTTAAVLRAGVKQHILGVFNGNGVGDAGRSQVYVDGDAYPLTFVNAVPPTTGNLDPVAFYSGGTSTAGYVGGRYLERLHVPAFTPGQARAAYLKNFAQRVTLRETLEDVPVSLTSSVGVGAQIGNWTVVSGTWKVSETSDGKRWLENVTAGYAVLPIQSQAFGTCTMFVSAHHSGAAIVLFIASSATALTTNGPNGYGLYLNTPGGVQLVRYTAGAFSGNLFYSASAYTQADTVYQYTFSRRTSDCQFKGFIKGGVYTQHTLVDPTGGGGTNPVADTNYVTSKAISISFSAGDKMCMFDPNDKHVALLTYSGQLDPTAGEIP
jgi:hypothetical protein